MDYEDFYVWQDREVRFDVSKTQLALRNGERVFDTISNIEDTKGNNGDIGTLIFSNLRLLWYCQENIKINLSLGYECILSSEVKSISSKVAGETKAIAIKCKFNGNRFEFLFNAVCDDSPKLFSSFSLIYKGYDTSRLYRDIKMKGFLTQDKNLITLPSEEVLTKVMGVGSYNNELIVNGIFYLTNIRVVWFSNTLDNFNVSLPWIQIKQVKTREVAKHGKVAALETGKGLTGNIFYFKFPDKIESAVKEIENAFKKYTDNPILGIDLSDTQVVESINKGSRTNLKFGPSTNNVDLPSQKKQSEEFTTLLNAQSEDPEVIETNYFNEQSNMLHYMTSNSEKKNVMSDIVFSPQLGLAIERLPENVTIDNLWKIIV